MSNITVLVSSMGRGGQEVSIPSGSTANDAIRAAGLTIQAAKKIKINGTEAALDSVLNDQDTILIVNKGVTGGGDNKPSSGVARCVVDFVVDGQDVEAGKPFWDSEMTAFQLVETYAGVKGINLTYLKLIKNSAGESVPYETPIVDGETYTAVMIDPATLEKQASDEDEGDLVDED